jgi:hypothetical protein
MKQMFWKTSEVSKDTLRIKPGLEVPRHIAMTGVHTDELPDIRLDLEAEYSPAISGYEITYSGIRHQRGYLRSEDFKELKINDILEYIFSALPTEQREPMGRKEKADYLAIKAGEKDVLLREVALRVAVSRLASRRENAEVMECFEVSQATATRWIAAARKAGLLD